VRSCEPTDAERVVNRKTEADGYDGPDEEDKAVMRQLDEKRGSRAPSCRLC
jgi:hypothetical protein